MIQSFSTLISRNRKFIPISVTVGLFFLAYAFGAFSYPSMRDPQVFLNLFRTSHFLMISAIGSTFVILTGGIDLSVTGVVALTTVASAALLRSGETNTWSVMLLMLAMGTALGAVMGFFITYLKVQPFIATLAGQWFAKGMCFFISDDAIPINDRLYRILGQTKILIPGLSDPVTQQGPYISILVLVEVAVLIIALYLAHYTRFGRTVYAIGGNEGRNEQSARLMGLPVDATKMGAYTLNGFCSALAGICLSIYVMSGHGLYARGLELDVIASVVIGGTMLTGGSGYVFGTVFGVLVNVVIQTLIQFNGQLSSWWTRIVVGMLTLVFIGVQSLLAARKGRKAVSKKTLDEEEGVTPASRPKRWKPLQSRNQQILVLSVGVIAILILSFFALRGDKDSLPGSTTTLTSPFSSACERKPFRDDQADHLIQSGAVIAYERNGGSMCVDELYGIFPDGLITADDGTNIIEKQVSPQEIEQLLADITSKGWFTTEMYDTWHTPCEQCYGYHLTVLHQGQEKTVKAVDGGTDAPANYWQVVSAINGLIPKLIPTP